MASRPIDGMAELRRLAAMLAVQSLDLRAEYEAKLRILTDIQRDIETLRAADATTGARHQALDRLQRRFNALAAANRDASSTLKLIRDEFEHLRGRRRRRTHDTQSTAASPS